MNINFSRLFQKTLPFVYIIFSSYICASMLFFYLPKTGVDFVKDSSTNLDYKKYEFYSIPKKSEIQQFENQNKNIQTLDKYELKAIYSTISNKGWINIEDKSSNQSHILSFGDKIDEYELFALFKDYVLFRKNNKEYKLEIKEKEIPNFDIEEAKNEEIQIKENGAVINRNYLNSYVTNIDNIWNNITINEIKNGQFIDGFKIEKIKKKSVFEKLGLKENDVIKSVNNSELNSYAKAFEVFNDLANIRYLNIEILRNNELVELNYEID